MLAGFVAWPDDEVARWKSSGYREGRVVADIVCDTAVRSPDKVAVIEGDRRLSYAQLTEQVDRLAIELRHTGLKPLDRVVMQLPNSIEFVVSFLALMRLGAIPVMALRAHRYSEIRHFVDASGAVAYMVPGMFHQFDYRQLAQEIQGACPTLTHVFVVDGALPGQHALGELIARTQSPALPTDRPALDPVDPAQVALMLLSGGTTSLSKLIPRTHDDYVLNARLCAQAAGFDEHTVFLALLPLGHNYNLAAPGMLGVFYFGGTLLIGHGTDADHVFPLVQQHRVTAIAAAVPLITNWLNSDVPARFDLSSLRVVQNGGAALAPELRGRIRSQWGATPQEIYGTAEGLINMTRLDDADDVLLTSSGAPSSRVMLIRPSAVP
jgi:2,3-dihydroxybenzoate-AMP ligase